MNYTIYTIIDVFCSKYVQKQNAKNERFPSSSFTRTPPTRRATLSDVEKQMNAPPLASLSREKFRCGTN